MFTYLFVTIIDNRFIKNVIKWLANVYNIWKVQPAQKVLTNIVM